MSDSRTQSVCKWCSAPLVKSNQAWTDNEGAILCRNQNFPFHEPISEPASTGEPKISDVLLAANPETALREITKLRNQLAARPSGPSAPLYSEQELKEQGLQATTTNYGKEGSATMYSPAPQTSASLTCPHGFGPDQTCIECEPAYPNQNAVAPQPVSGDALTKNRAHFSLSPVKTHVMLGVEETTMIATVIANEFSNQLRRSLTAEVLAEVVKLNNAETDKKGICHTHDFCDANMEMIAALETLGIIKISDALWNEAWSIAKGGGFNPSPSAGEAPKVEEIALKIATATSACDSFNEIRRKTEAILRPYFPPASQTPGEQVEEARCPTCNSMKLDLSLVSGKLLVTCVNLHQTEVPPIEPSSGVISWNLPQLGQFFRRPRPCRDAVKWLEDMGYGVNGKFALDSKRNWQGYEIKEILELFALGFPESGRTDPLATPASTARTDGPNFATK